MSLITEGAAVADLPVAIIGAGPIGLAAAAHLATRREPFVVIEAGSGPATSIMAWGYVPLFTPWRYNVDPVAASVLTRTGWQAPDPIAYPTGGEFVERYLQPLAHHPDIGAHVRYGQRVRAITRDTLSKLDEERDDHPFVIDAVDQSGHEISIRARAVIDASGSWNTPNPLGANGRLAPGEAELSGHIHYGIPNIPGEDRARYAGRRTLVVGSGHSAFHSLKHLAFLAQEQPGTRVLWALRRDTAFDATAGCAGDELTERTLLRREVDVLLREATIEAFPATRLTKLEPGPDGIVAFAGDRPLPPVDEIIVATGFRPDHGLARELRLDVHSVFESTYALAPLIDPTVSACGTAPPHGVVQLAHPEPDYYVVGMKSYGRAPTFLLLTGYEQVRSVVCALTGDEAALTIELDLPDKGLCSACTAFLEEREREAGCQCDDDSPGDHCCAVPASELDREPQGVAAD